MKQLIEELPESWLSCELGDLVRIKHGYAFKSKNFTASGYVIVTPGNFTPDGFLDFTTKRVVRRAGDIDDEWILNNGDLLVVMTDLSQKKLILGATVMLQEEEVILHNQRIGLLIPFSSNILKEYIRFAMLRPRYKKYVDDTATGTLIQHTSPTKLCQGNIPLPPLNEQKRIVAKIEALQGHSSRAREALEAVGPLLEKFRQSVLASAFRGDLTREWRQQNPDVEPAEVLLERIREERRTRWIEAEAEKGRARAEAKATKAGKSWTAADDEKALEKARVKAEAKYKEPEPPDTSELPELPEGWCWAWLTDCGEMARGKSKHRPRNDPKLFEGGTYPFIQTGEVAQSAGRITSASKFYSEFGLKQGRLFPSGTVCITIAANIAETSVLGIDACFPDSVVGIIVDNKMVTPEYTELYIRTIRDDLAAYASGTAQKNINLGVLSKVAIAIPPPEERRLLEKKLQQALTYANEVESKIADSTPQLNRLNQSILAKAFRGELVPQDPNDEPASVLLERIKAEREAAAPKKKKTTRRKKAKS